MAEQNLEDRVAYLEQKIAEYEAERALVRELHELRDDLRLRIQATGAEIRDEIDSQADALRTEYQAGYGYLVERINDTSQELGERIGGVEQAVTGLAGQVQGLAAGQQQILELLQGGKPKTND
jgi:ABC-type transporter Mla subunit MlaD